MWNISNIEYDADNRIVQIKLPDSYFSSSSSKSNYIWYQSDDYGDYRDEEMLYVECTADDNKYNLDYVIKMKRLNLNVVKITA